jgi:hypothetical protein
MPSNSNPTVRYTEQDFVAVAEFMAQYEGLPMEKVYGHVAEFLSERQDRVVTVVAVKNMVNRGRYLGLIPHGPRSRKPKAKAKKKAVPNVVVYPADQPKPKAVKKFDPGMTADDLFDFNVQVIYAELDKMPVTHLGPLHDFRKACEALLEALSK